jgi:hypothetical protein
MIHALDKLEPTPDYRRGVTDCDLHCLTLACSQDSSVFSGSFSIRNRVIMHDFLLQVIACFSPRARRPGHKESVGR